MQDVIRYSRERQLEIPVHRIMISNLGVFALENLRFYEKFMVLALKNGVKAEKTNSHSALIDVLSQAFNIKRVFVESFIVCFSELNYLSYDYSTHTYLLSKNFEFFYNEKDKSIIMAKTKEEKIELTNLYAVPICESFFKDKDIEDEELTLNGLFEFPKEYTKDDLEAFVASNKETVNDLIKETLTEKNYYFQSLNYEIGFFPNNYKIKLDVLINYEYKDNISKMKDISIQQKFEKLFNKDKIQAIAEKKYLEDKNLPRFITQHDYFENYAKDVEEIKNKIFQEEKLRKRTDDEKQKIDHIEKQLNTIKGKLKKNEKSKNTEKESIRRQLNDELREIQEENLKLKEINEATAKELNSIKKEKASLYENLEITEKKHQEGTNDTVIEIKKKFCDSTLLSMEIIEFATSIDECISLSDGLGYDILFLKMIEIRGKSHQVFKLILDVFTKSNEEKLASYIENNSMKAKLETTYKISGSVLENMKQFKMFMDACAHFSENNKRTVKNRKVREDFKSKTKEERKKILLSFLDFLIEADLKQDQRNKIEKLLKSLLIGI